MTISSEEKNAVISLFSTLICDVITGSKTSYSLELCPHCGKDSGESESNSNDSSGSGQVRPQANG
jgi:hypothetical protein